MFFHSFKITNILDIPNDLFEDIFLFLSLKTIVMMLIVNKRFQFIHKSNKLLKYFMNLSVYKKPEKNKYIVCNRLSVVDVKPMSQPMALNYAEFKIPDRHYIFYAWKSYFINNKIIAPYKFRELYTQLNLYEASIKQFSINYNGWKIFNKSDIWNSLSRIVSYTSWNNYSITNLHDKLFKPRKLNNNEQKVFNIVRIDEFCNTFKCTILKTNIYNTQSELVMNFTRFAQNFNRLYLCAHWFYLINWNNFCIAGGSILAALLNKDWTNQTGHDIDIFAYEISHCEFVKQFMNILSNLDSNNYTFTNTFNVKTLKLSLCVSDFFGHKTMYKNITLQFIYIAHLVTPNIILHNFDLDIVQILYQPNKKRVFATDAFIQSLNTNTIIPYNLIRNAEVLSIRTLSRIKKYIIRGFNQILIPKSISVTILTHLLNQTNKKIDNRVIRNYLVINADHFGTQEKMIRNILS